MRRSSSSSVGMLELLKNVDQWSNISKKLSFGEQNVTLPLHSIQEFSKEITKAVHFWVENAFRMSQFPIDGEEAKLFLERNFRSLLSVESHKYILDPKEVHCQRLAIQIEDLNLQTSPSKRKNMRAKFTLGKVSKSVDLETNWSSPVVEMFVLNLKSDEVVIELYNSRDKWLGRAALSLRDLESKRVVFRDITNGSKIIGKISFSGVIQNRNAPNVLEATNEMITQAMLSNVSQALGLEINCADTSLECGLGLGLRLLELEGSDEGETFLLAGSAPVPLIAEQGFIFPISSEENVDQLALKRSMKTNNRRRSSITDLIFTNALNENQTQVRLSEVEIGKSTTMDIGEHCKVLVEWQVNPKTHLSLVEVLEVLIFSKLKLLPKDHLNNWFGDLDSSVLDDIQRLIKPLVPLEEWDKAKSLGLLSVHSKIQFNSFLMFEVLKDLNVSDDFENLEGLRDFLKHCANFLVDQLLEESFQDTRQIYGKLKCIHVLKDRQILLHDGFQQFFNQLWADKLLRLFMSVPNLEVFQELTERKVSPTTNLLRNNSSLLIESWINKLGCLLLDQAIPIVMDLSLLDRVPNFECFLIYQFFVKYCPTSQRAFYSAFKTGLKRWPVLELEEGKSKVDKLLSLDEGDSWLEHHVHLQEIIKDSLERTITLEWPDPATRSVFVASMVESLGGVIEHYISKVENAPGLILSITSGAFWLSTLDRAKAKISLEIVQCAMERANQVLDDKLHLIFAQERESFVTLVLDQAFEDVLDKVDTILKLAYEEIVESAGEYFKDDEVTKNICQNFFYDEFVPKYFELLGELFCNHFQSHIQSKLAQPDKNSKIVQAFKDALDKLLEFQTEFHIDTDCLTTIQDEIQSKFVPAKELIAQDVKHLYELVEGSMSDLEVRAQLKFKIAILEHSQKVLVELLSLSHMVPLEGNLSANPRMVVSLLPSKTHQQDRYATQIYYNILCCALDMEEDRKGRMTFDLPAGWRDEASPVFILLELYDHWNVVPSAPVTQKIFRGLKLIKASTIPTRLRSDDGFSSIEAVANDLVSVKIFHPLSSPVSDLLKARRDGASTLHLRRQENRLTETWIHEIPDVANFSKTATSNLPFKLPGIIVRSERGIKKNIRRLHRNLRKELQYVEIGTTKKVQSTTPRWPLR